MKNLFTTSTLAFLSFSAVAQAADLDDQAKAAILSALDDEYHAESVYAATMEKHGAVRPFVNIIQAEVRHSSALISLLRSYGEEVPENPYANGAKALDPIPDTLAAACELGVAAEIENIRLYDEELLPVVGAFADVKRVMQNLRDASEDKHLPAFQRCGGAGGQGNGHGNGQGKGQGLGKMRGN